MENMIIWIIIMFLIIFLGKTLENKLSNKKNTPPTIKNTNTVIYKQKTFMTPSEKNFYQKLRPLESQYKIIPQINLGTIIDKITDTRFQTELYRNIDYGIFTSDFSKILLLIELNDSSHEKPQRKRRDIKVHEICKNANIPIITFYTNYPNEQQYVLNRIINEINKSNTITIPKDNNSNMNTPERS